MGLTKNKRFALQQCMTKVFRTLWEGADEIKPQEIVSTTQLANKDYRFKCYPVNTLNSRQFYEKPTSVVMKIGKDDRVVEVKGIGKVDFSKEFDKSHPVFAVFVTNCNGFLLKSTKFSVNPSNVDWEGKLNVALPHGTISGLRDNVELRFLFF
jgi:hypothetical protein